MIQPLIIDRVFSNFEPGAENPFSPQKALFHEVDPIVEAYKHGMPPKDAFALPVQQNGHINKTTMTPTNDDHIDSQNLVEVKLKINNNQSGPNGILNVSHNHALNTENQPLNTPSHSTSHDNSNKNSLIMNPKASNGDIHGVKPDSTHDSITSGSQMREIMAQMVTIPPVEGNSEPATVKVETVFINKKGEVTVKQNGALDASDTSNDKQLVKTKKDKIKYNKCAQCAIL